MAASQASGSTQCSTSPWCQTWDSLEPAGYSGSWNFTGSGRILDLPFRRLGGQNVEDDCRCVILVRLPAEPLHEVSERGGLHTSDLFGRVRPLPVPVVVFLSTAHHQLRAPGEKLVLVRDPICDQKIKSSFCFVGVPNHPRGELGTLSRVLSNEAHLSPPYRLGVLLFRDKVFPRPPLRVHAFPRSEEHTSELQSRENLVCRL